MKRILIAPLNWGLGHTTRCIPLINAVLETGNEPILASDGASLQLLKKEFPNLKTYELPSYNITYPKKKSAFKYKMLKETPHLIKTISAERKVIQKLAEIESLDGIISDNRFGVRHRDITSVFITHQLRVLSGRTTWLSTAVHQRIIKKFDYCWIPDYEGNQNLSGQLGHDRHSKIKKTYIGPISRFTSKILAPKYDLLVLLSGPEPQRTILQDILLSEFKDFDGSVLFVKGIIETQQNIELIGNIKIVNYMTSSELEIAINTSKLVLARSGYTTIMDLAKLGKKAFFIPTPGQYEQVYLAKKHHEEGIAPSCSQNTFNLKMLEETTKFSGFKKSSEDFDLKSLLNFF